MYGQPKIHKGDTPLRPIIATTGSYNSSLSRYLVKLLSPLIQSIFSVKDSFSFVNEINTLDDHNYVMASFDVVSLYSYQDPSA